MRPKTLFSRGTADFGIKRFKRQHKDDSKLIAMFKQNVWRTMSDEAVREAHLMSKWGMNPVKPSINEESK